MTGVDETTLTRSIVATVTAAAVFHQNQGDIEAFFHGHHSAATVCTNFVMRSPIIMIVVAWRPSTGQRDGDGKVIAISGCSPLLSIHL
jgi:hypothetical protein